MNKALRIVLLCVFGLGFGVFFSPVVIYGVFNIGNISGMAAFGALFCAVLFREKTKALARRVWRKGPGKAVSLLLAAALLSGGVWAGATGAGIVQAAKNAPPENEALTVIVLGCRVYDSGPSRMLISRVNAAYGYLAAHPDAVCILSGGQGDDEPMAEAQAMFDMLTEKGIDEARLIKEERSTSTLENLSFSLEIIRERGLNENVALVTNEYHQRRAALMAERLGFAACYAVSAPSQKILLPTYFVREIFGIAYLKSGINEMRLRHTGPAAL